MDVQEVKKLDAYLKKLFGNPRIRVVPRPKKDDSAEVYVGEEFVGVMALRSTIYPTRRVLTRAADAVPGFVHPSTTTYTVNESDRVVIRLLTRSMAKNCV